MIIYRYDLKADVTQEITVPGADIEVLGVKDSLVGFVRSVDRSVSGLVP